MSMGMYLQKESCRWECICRFRLVVGAPQTVLHGVILGQEFTSQQMAFTGRILELMKKYGKVALGVHFSVSAASIAGLYVSIRNNVDVESLLEKVGISGVSKEPIPPLEEKLEPDQDLTMTEKKNQTAESAAYSGGALALAILCNKALIPVRVPITIALTPPIARFLARRKIIKNRM